MHSGTDYVLLAGDEDVDNSSTFNIIDRLMGNPIPRPVNVPEILISQHNNAMQFHYANYNAVKTKMKHALRERNAAITEIARLTDIREGRGVNLIKAYTQVVDDILPTLGTAVFNLAKPTLLHNLGTQLDKERLTLHAKNQQLAALKKELKDHTNEILKCFNEIQKVKITSAESKVQEPEHKEEAVDQSPFAYLQMSH